MKKSTRSFLFLLFLALFLLVTPLVIAYSQGYRVNWQDKTIVKTGALFFEPRPAPVELYIDGDLVKKSSFVFQNIFAGDLIPRDYAVEIRKKGYLSWEKTLGVSPKLVTEARNITLFPDMTSASAAEVRSAVEAFFPSHSGKHIAIVEKSQSPLISIYSTEKQSETLRFSAPEAFYGYEINDVQWNGDSVHLLFSMKRYSQKKWVSVDVTSAALSSIDISEKIAASEGLRDYIGLYRPIIRGVKWSKSKSNVINFSADDARGRPLSFAYDIESGKLSLLLGEEEGRAAPEEAGIVSDDGKKILTMNKEELSVLWLEEIKIQPFRSPGDFETIYTAKGQVHDAIWFSKNNEYVIFSADGEIKAAELDSRGERNIHTLIAQGAEKLFYEPKSEILYFLSSETLYALLLK